MDPDSLLQRYVFDAGIMMFFLIPAAFLMIAYTIQGFVNLRSGRVCPRRFEKEFPEIMERAETLDEAESALSAKGHSIGLILGRSLRHLELRPEADAADVLRDEIDEECASLQQRNSQLAVIYNIAPLMGLLGTVFGMIRTFQDFASSADPSVRELGAGVNVALLTTAWGLSIAIPAFLFLYIFTRRIHHYERVVLPTVGSKALPLLMRKANRAPSPDLEV